MDWSSGYVSDVNYTHGYYAGLNPLNLNLALIHAGIRPPIIKNACELGFGQGISINFHSADNSINWAGNDFNPAHVSFAKELNSTIGNKTLLSDDDFEKFCKYPNLPNFDFIGLHGIWSWVSNSNKSIIIEFIKNKLNVGGVVYVSYNSQNAWASMIPVRDLMTYYVNTMEPSGSGRIGGINGALKFIEKLNTINPKFLETNPILKQRLKRIQGQNREYLAHEYFNKDWEAVNFGKLNESFSKAKLSYVAPSNHLNAIDKLNLTKKQLELLAEIKDPVLYQIIKDFCVNAQFRAEYWVKGPRRLTSFDQINEVRKIRVQLIENPDQIILKTQGDLGEIELSEKIYNPILDFLSDFKTKTIAEIESNLKNKEINITLILQSVMILVSKRALGLVQDENVINNNKSNTENLNKYLINHAFGSDEIHHLVSPRTISGIVVGRIEKIFIASMLQGKKHPKEWATFAWETINSQGQRILKNNEEINDKIESINFLTEKAEEFDEKRVPILKALMVL